MSAANPSPEGASTQQNEVLFVVSFYDHKNPSASEET